MKKTIALALMLTLSAFGANATIVDNGLYTTDDTAGLNFLDITQTGAHSLGYYQSGFNHLGQTWRLATLAELETLFTEIVGYNVDHGSSSTVNFAAGGGKAIMDLLAGVTIDSTNDLGYGFYGYYDNSSETNSRNSMGIHYDCCNDTHLATLNISSDTYAWMVSTSSVPAPAPLALVGLGLLGLGAMRKRATTQH